MQGSLVETEEYQALEKERESLAKILEEAREVYSKNAKLVDIENGLLALLELTQAYIRAQKLTYERQMRS